MTVIEQTGVNIFVVEVTIASGASESEVIDTRGLSLVGIVMPAVWTAAELRFKGAVLAGDTLKTIKDMGGNALRVTVAANDFITSVGNDAIYSPHLKLVSTDGTGTAVNQAAARVIQLIMRSYLS